MRPDDEKVEPSLEHIELPDKIYGADEAVEPDGLDGYDADDEDGETVEDPQKYLKELQEFLENYKEG